mmetsp:Transcript_15170/g.28574  ORF Transcript_15170/g.28574 Transcript_15170/m.28574 type:complete len:210 (-) Transcript_15170:76-705(-)
MPSGAVQMTPVPFGWMRKWSSFSYSDMEPRRINAYCLSSTVLRVSLIIYLNAMSILCAWLSGTALIAGSNTFSRNLVTALFLVITFSTFSISSTTNLCPSVLFFLSLLPAELSSESSTLIKPNFSFRISSSIRRVWQSIPQTSRSTMAGPRPSGGGPSTSLSLQTPSCTFPSIFSMRFSTWFLITSSSEALPILPVVSSKDFIQRSVRS